MIQVDLYLGSDLGRWALDHVEPEAVRHVITDDAEAAELAEARGLPILRGDVHAADFEAAAVGFSVHYPRILKPALLARYRTIYNLHPGYLPWGRGYYPIFWALWEQTPAGATLHEIDAGIDRGPIVAQTRVPYDAHDWILEFKVCKRTVRIRCAASIASQ